MRQRESVACCRLVAPFSGHRSLAPEPLRDGHADRGDYRDGKYYEKSAEITEVQRSESFDSWLRRRWRVCCIVAQSPFRPPSVTLTIAVRPNQLNFTRSVYLLCPDLRREEALYKMIGSVCLSVYRVPRLNSRTERHRKPKIGRMEWKPITRVIR